MKGFKPALFAVLICSVVQTNAQTDTTVQSLGEVVITANRTTQAETVVPYVVNHFTPKQFTYGLQNNRIVWYKVIRIITGFQKEEHRNLK